jgi:UDP-N-acetylmuramate--alanine ligase
MKDLDLSKIKSIFFIGIGGIGISALAKMALSRGIVVSGINDEESPKTLDPLASAGASITFQENQKDAAIREADLYVYSDAWLHRGPEIIEHAKSTGKPVMNYFEALGIFAKEYKVIAVAGTHGKTTTTAMIAEILVDAGLDPTVIVGSFIKKFDSNFKKGSGEYMVVEADEYNRHFLSLNPLITVITNVEADHLDCFKDLGDIQDAFKKLISQTKNNIIYNDKDANTSILVHEYKGRVVDYSKYLDKATASGGAPQYAVVPKLSVPGDHNRMNAAAAMAVSEILKIPDGVAKKSLASFQGTWRRLEKKGVTPEGVIIYDDYAHHPTEIKASLQALRELYPNKKITVLFQPHLYSRTKALFDDFAKSFKGADKVFVLPIYFAREESDESITSEKLAEAIRLSGEDALAFSSFELAEKAVKTLNLGSKDVFVTMGAGEAHKVAEKVFKTS